LPNDHFTATWCGLHFDERPIAVRKGR
jgi:hypothetical protein